MALQSSCPSAAVWMAPADASQLPQWLFGFAGLIPDGFGSRVIRLSPKGQRACQVSPHINVVLLTPWVDSTARQRGKEKHWSGMVGGTGGWRETCIVHTLNKIWEKVLSEFLLRLRGICPTFGESFKFSRLSLMFKRLNDYWQLCILFLLSWRKRGWGLILTGGLTLTAFWSYLASIIQNYWKTWANCDKRMDCLKLCKSWKHFTKWKMVTNFRLFLENYESGY